MKRVRVLLSGFLSLAAIVGALAFANPASAAVPPVCSQNNYPVGDFYETTNNSVGGGAHLRVAFCGVLAPDGLWDTKIWFTVTDTEANAAGATIQIRYTYGTGGYHYWVPSPSQRAWSLNEVARGSLPLNGLYAHGARACLTNADNPAHTCGPWVG